MGKVIASIHAKRAELREQIQTGASGPIRPTVRSRAKAEIADAPE
jgi:hypothetical protein